MAAARAAGVPVWSEVELAARMLPENPIVGRHGHERQDDDHRPARRDAARRRRRVRGRRQRRPAAVASSPADRRRETWIACELSSFQLEDIDRLRLPRRGDPERHARPPRPPRRASRSTRAASCASSRTRRAGDTAVLNDDDAGAARRGAARRGRARVVHARPTGARSTGSTPGCAGEHNLENALAAAAAAEAAGVERGWRSTRRCARSRRRRTGCEPVAAAGGVDCVNDSKATNPEATIKALTAFDSRRPPDPGRLAQGRRRSRRWPRRSPPGRSVRSYLIGAAADADRRRARRRPASPFRRCETLEAAVAAAAAAARAGRHRAALAGLRELRPVPRLRAPRRPASASSPAPPAQRGLTPLMQAGVRRGGEHGIGVSGVFAEASGHASVRGAAAPRARAPDRVPPAAAADAGPGRVRPDHGLQRLERHRRRATARTRSRRSCARASTRCSGSPAWSVAARFRVPPVAAAPADPDADRAHRPADA